MKYLLIFFEIIILYSCGTGYRLSEGGFRPNELNFEFSKAPYYLEDNSLLDTKSIYLEKTLQSEINTPKGLFQRDTLYTILSFF